MESILKPEPEELEAEHVYLLMSHKYRISRNVRAQWYFSNLNKFINIPKRHSLEEYTCDVDVVSALPREPPPDWDSDTAHLYKYRITASTHLTFLARMYRLVFCLDLSPSVASVDAVSGVSLLESVFPCVKRCLKGVTRPFYVPGSELLYRPLLYITVIAHTPFFTSQTHQVLVQGWMVSQHNLDSFLDTLEVKLEEIEDRFAVVSALAKQQLETQRLESERITGQLFEDDYDADSVTTTTTTVPMVSPDIGFVNMLRYGILALQLLPEKSGAGLVVVTDGAIALPDATMFDSLLVQLRNNTVACSFVLLTAGAAPSAQLGHLPYTDLMRFLATATCGALLQSLPPLVAASNYDYPMNLYHDAFLSWAFQRSPIDSAFVGAPATVPKLGVFVSAPPLQLMSKRQACGTLSSSLKSVLSCRLREGYNVQKVSTYDSHIRIDLVLPWKHAIFIEYQLRSSWPPRENTVNYEITITATYDFLHDVTCTRASRAKSPYRRAMFNKFWLTLKSLRHTDQLLCHLHAFNRTSQPYTVPETVRRGNALFYMTEDCGSVEPFSRDPGLQPLCDYWRPVCLLDINIWEKWMHAHRIGLLLEHDHPLPKHLFLPNNSGRHHSVQCRQATKAVTTLLANTSDFTLMDGHSYIKFLYRDDSEVPFSFYLLRINMMVRPPCMVVRLAFLGGTSVDMRYQIVDALRRQILALSFVETYATHALDRPIRKNASRVTRSVSLQPEEGEASFAVGAVTTDHRVSWPSSRQDNNNNSASRHVTHKVKCCVLVQKPIEKFLIRYDRVPRNYLLPVIQKSPSSVSCVGRAGGASGRTDVITQNKTASAMFNILSRYLHHRRWVWCMQTPQSTALSMEAMGRILSAIVKTRLREGFCFVHSSAGVTSLALEASMQNPVRCRGSSVPPAVHPCVLQYVLFPPRHQTSGCTTTTTDCASQDNVAASDDEQLCEGGGDSEVGRGNNARVIDNTIQLVTECWIEPQSGLLTDSGNISDDNDRDGDDRDGDDSEAAINRLSPFMGLTYDQAAAKFFDIDHECISSLLTLEYLCVMCDEEARDDARASSPPAPPTSPPHQSPPPHPLSPHPSSSTNAEQRDQSIQEVGFCFDLPLMLRRCCQTEILLSTYIQDLSRLINCPGAEVNSFSAAAELDDTANTQLFELLLDTIAALHRREVTLHAHQCRAIASLIVSRARLSGQPPPPFTDAELSDGRVPRWRCFVKCVSASHALVTLLPASYADLKLLASTRLNNAASSTNSCGGGGYNNNTSNGRLSDGDVLAACQLVPADAEHSLRLLFDSASRRNSGSASAGRRPALPNTAAVESVEQQSLQQQQAVGRSRGRARSFGSAVRSHRVAASACCNDAPAQCGGGRRFPLRSLSFPNSGSSSGCTSVSGRDVTSDIAAPSTNLAAAPSTNLAAAEERPVSSSTSLPGALNLPVYVYDCPLRSLTRLLTEGRDTDCTTASAPDNVSRDERFILSDRPLDGAPITLGRFNSRATHSSDAQYLSDHCDVIQMAHTRAFVVAIFRWMQRRSQAWTAHALDIQSAIDVCDEHPLEVDLTGFIKTICGHVRQLIPATVSQSASCLSSTDSQPLAAHQSPPLNTNSSTADSWPDKHTSSAASGESTHASAAASVSVPVSALLCRQPCAQLQRLHSEAQRRFDRILAANFALASGSDDVYYYVAPGLRANTEVCDCAVSPLPDDNDGEADNDDGDSELDDNDDDVTVQFRDIGASGVWSEVQCVADERDSAVTRTSRTSIMSVAGSGSLTDLEERALQMADEDEDSENEHVDDRAEILPPPLFLQLTCSVRVADECHTRHVRKLPTCIGELVHDLKAEQVNLNTLQVSLDILCLTLPDQVDTRIMERSKPQQLRATSFCSDGAGSSDAAVAAANAACSACVSACAANCLSDSTSITDDDEHVSMLMEDGQCAGAGGGGHLHQAHRLLGVTLAQQEAALATRAELQWLLVDEVLALLVHVTPVQPDTLTAVVDHVRRSAGQLQCTFPRRSCVHKQVPLNFVFGAAQSFEVFQQYFSGFSVPGYKLSQLDSLFYVVSERSPAAPPVCLWPSAVASTCAVERRCCSHHIHQCHAAHLSSLPATYTTAGIPPSPHSQDEVVQMCCDTQWHRSSHRSAEQILFKTRLARSISADLLLARAREESVTEDTDYMTTTTTTTTTTFNTTPAYVRCQSASATAIECDGYDGDNSDSDHDTPSQPIPTSITPNTRPLSTAFAINEPALKPVMPNFWLIVSVASHVVDVYFHCRYRHDSLLDNMKVVDDVCACLQRMCKRVNQTMLLENLETTKVCNNLLEPESSEEIWSRNYRESYQTGVCESYYLEANMQFRAGYFACDVVFCTCLTLHRRLCGAAATPSPGVVFLCHALQTLAVTNRRQMFVVRDTKHPRNVFYIRLRDSWEAGDTGSGGELGAAGWGGAGGMAASSQTDRDSGPSSSATRDETCVGITAVAGGGSLSSRVSLRSETEDAVEIIVHGIAEPSESIRCDLIESLRARLDDRLQETIAKALLRNPQTKLTVDDVRFIQPAGTAPQHALKYTIPETAVTHISLVLLYLKKNLQHVLQTPSYADHRIEHQFRNYGGCDSADIYIFVPPKTRSSREMAVVSVTPVYSASASTVLPSISSGGEESVSDNKQRNTSAADVVWHEDMFDQLTSTTRLTDSTDHDTYPPVWLLFNVWEKCDAGISYLQEQLALAIRHSLWDVCLQLYVLSCQPVMLASRDLTSSMSGGARTMDDVSSSTLARFLERRITTPQVQEQHRRFRRFSTSSYSSNSTLRCGERVSDGFGGLRSSAATTALLQDVVNERVSSSALGGSSPASDNTSASSSALLAPTALTLHSVYGATLHRWLEFGRSLQVSSLRQCSVQLLSAHMAGGFLSQLVSVLCEDEDDSTDRLLCGVFRPLTPSQQQQQQYVSCSPHKLVNCSCDNYLLVACTRRELCDNWSAYRLSSPGSQLSPSGATTTAPAAAVSLASSSLSAPQSPLLLSSASTQLLSLQNTPLAPSGGDCKKHRLVWGRFYDKKLVLFTYSWPRNKWQRLSQRCAELSQWTNARSCLISSIQLQKLGLFHNQPFTRKTSSATATAPGSSTDQNARAYTNQPAFVGHLIKHTAPPATISCTVSRQGAGRSRWLTDALRDCQPPPLVASSTGGGATIAATDRLSLHGQQFIEVCQNNRKTEEHRRLYQQCKSPESLNKQSTMQQLVGLVTSSGRLLHFCYTPLLLLPSWRWQTDTARHQTDTPPAAAAAGTTTSSASTYVSHRPRVSESTSSDTAAAAAGPGRPSPRLRRLAGDQRWHDSLCCCVVRELAQYLESIGFLPLPGAAPSSSVTATTSSPSASSSTAPHKRWSTSRVRTSAVDSGGGVSGGRNDAGSGAVVRTHSFTSSNSAASSDAVAVTYLHRVLFPGGGYLLFEVGVRQPFIYIKLYALDGLRPQFRHRTAAIDVPAFESFLVECSKIRAHVHLHSYMFDYHLRAMHQYVNDRPLMMRQGLHIISFLHDFHRYYHKAPTHARNCMTSGCVTVDNLGPTTPDQLYNYMLAHEKRYQLRVLRMIPLFESVGDDMCDSEFVMVRVSSLTDVQQYSVTESESGVYDVTLVVSRGLVASSHTAANKLMLQFYILLTSRSEVYPSMFVERKFENYCRVQPSSCCHSAIVSSSCSPHSAPHDNVACEVLSDTKATSVMDVSVSGEVASRPVSHSQLSTQSTTADTIGHESVHYMGYYSCHEKCMQSVLKREATLTRAHISATARNAKFHCRCDFLWQKLKESRNQMSSGEMAELLSMLQCRQLQLLDRRLLMICNKSADWYSGLFNRLAVKYASSHRRVESVGRDGRRYMVVMLPADTGALISVAVHAQQPPHHAWLIVGCRRAAPDVAQFDAANNNNSNDNDDDNTSNSGSRSSSSSSSSSLSNFTPSTAWSSGSARLVDSSGSCEPLCSLVDQFVNCCLLHLWSTLCRR